MTPVAEVASSPAAAAAVRASTWLVVRLAVVAAVATLLAAWPLVVWLRRLELGKAIRTDGPAHAAKAGTPTMGGLAMLVGLAAAGAIAVAVQPAWRVDRQAWPLLIAVVLFGLLGLVDDVQGLARRSGRRELGVGLTARRAFALQAVAALVVAWSVGPEAVLRVPAELAATLGPGGVRLATTVDGLSAFALRGFGLMVAAGTILGTVNGTNLSDGLDGLAAGLAAIALASIALGAAWLHTATLPAPEDQAALVWSLPSLAAAVAAGSSLGFLYWNRHPARLFMGNVGSLVLGAILATTALQTGTWWLLPLVALVFVAEVLSDLLQVAYFKLTRGRRLFRMAPLHHHFELGGMPEYQVVRRFWLVGCLAAIAGLACVRWLAAGGRSP